MNPYRLARPLLYRFDAEATHDRVLAGLRLVSSSPTALAAAKRLYGYDDPRLATGLFDRRLPSPLGIAAGLDKNGVAVPALAALGFAFVEVGTVTPRPQTGNAKPRVFRLPEDDGLINRMGFPSAGMDEVATNLNRHRAAVFALNVGPNKERIDAAAEDCVAVMRRLGTFEPLYVVVNVSSPNTARLRDLQGEDALRRLLEGVLAGHPDESRATPILVKIALDLADAELDAVLRVAIDLGLAGIVATNTTTERPLELRGTARREQGGLSGKPLRDRATAIVRRIHQQTGGVLTIVAVGGVCDGADVLDKIGAGATVVQTYTGMIYEGPGMARRVKRQMAAILDRQGIGSVDLIRGTGYRAPR